MPEKDDWRRNGQEKHLMGARLRWQRFRKLSERWDHEHCEFCWQKFMEIAWDASVETEGFATLDGKHWICKPCYEEFKDELGFHEAGAAE